MSDRDSWWQQRPLLRDQTAGVENPGQKDPNEGSEQPVVLRNDVLDVAHDEDTILVVVGQGLSLCPRMWTEQLHLVSRSCPTQARTPRQ